MNKHLYDLAYQFKKTVLWKNVFEEEMFAIRLDNGEFGYCSLMGRNGEHTALAVYPGTSGLSSLRLAINRTGFRMSEVLIQNCLQCSFEKRDQFSTEELEEVLNYCRNEGLPQRAPFAQFSKHSPYCVPWIIESESDVRTIEKALEVVLALSDYLKTVTLEEAGLRGIRLEMDSESFFDDYSRTEPVTVPVYSVVDGKLHIDERVGLPAFEERKTKEPVLLDKKTVDAYKNAVNKAEGLILECGIERVDSIISGKPPYLPAMLFTVEHESGYAFLPVLGDKVDYDVDAMLEKFVGNLVASEVKPVEIRVRDYETWTLLKGFCTSCGIKLVRDSFLRMLDEVVESFNNMGF